MYIKKGYKPKLNPKYVQLDCCMGGIALEYQLFQFLQALLYIKMPLASKTSRVWLCIPIAKWPIYYPFEMG